MSARENYLYGEERPLPFWVQLVKIDANPTGPLLGQMPMMMHLDLRGGQFTRPTSVVLVKAFEWLTRAYNIRRSDLSDYALMITPLERQQDEQITGDHTPYIRDDWPDLRDRSFLWLPIMYDPNDQEDRRYVSGRHS